MKLTILKYIQDKNLYIDWFYTKNKKLENYYCCKCNSNEHIYMEVFSYPDGDETSCWVLHGDGAEVDFLKIDEMYELGLRSLDQKWLKYKK